MELTRRRVVQFGLSAGALMPFIRPIPLKAAESERDFILGTVSPELRPVAERMLTDPFATLTLDTLSATRKVFPPPSTKPIKVRVDVRSIPGAKGHPDVTIYVVNAKPGKQRPALLHTHGGGFILGSAQASLRDLQDVCLALDCPAVSVDYRLAPEASYAESIEDNYAGLKWLYHHASEIGADRSRIALLGDSAGGGHAALLAITARDRGEIPVAFQCLVYPMLDDRTGSSRAVPPTIGRLIWTPRSNRLAWTAFLGTKAGAPNAPPGVPARVADLKGLPPAFIGVGSIDLFFAEDVDYARRLGEAGVKVEMMVMPGAYHAFDVLMPETLIARQFTCAKIDALRRHLDVSGTP